MKGFKKLNLNTLLEAYRHLVQDDWDLGPNLERPRAWRLPMSTQRATAPGGSRSATPPASSTR